MSTQAIAADENSTAANRGGRMTVDQQKRVGAAVMAEAGPGLTGGAVFAFLLGAILWAENTSYSSHTDWRGNLLLGGLLAIALFAMASTIVRRWRGLREVNAGLVDRAEGKIIWQAGAYRAEVPGHTLNLSGFNLAAGTYTFSFLPASGRVIAAELVALDGPAQAQAELRHALAVANHFNLDDLPALREGRLGSAAPRYLRRVWTPALVLLVLALVMAALFAVLIKLDGAKDLAPLVFVAGALLGIGALMTALGALSETRDLLDREVIAVEGPVRKSMRHISGRNGGTSYHYRLDKQMWTVTAEAYRAIVDGPAYRVYYLPRSKMLVGIEPM